MSTLSRNSFITFRFSYEMIFCSDVYSSSLVSICEIVLFSFMASMVLEPVVVAA